MSNNLGTQPLYVYLLIPYELPLKIGCKTQRGK